MRVQVRELRRTEAWRWREMRLEALSESPDAFGSTYAAQVELPEAYWVEFVERRCDDPNLVALVGEIGPVATGMAWCEIQEPGPAGHLYSMWVAPEYRRRGVGHEIVREALAWMRRRGATSAELEVTASNRSAVSLYRSCGFADTGARRPLREGSDVEVAVMRCPL